MPVLTNGIQLAPGCYLDSRHGWRIVGRAIELAIDLGYEPSEPMDDLLATFYDEPWRAFSLGLTWADLDRIDSAIDRIYWESDRAIDWLTDSLTGDEPDRYWWGFNDGDFGLWENEAYAEYRAACEDENLEPLTFAMWQVNGEPEGPLG